ncbi:MAG: flagellar protein FlaG [Aestuariibacter sp.]
MDIEVAQTNLNTGFAQQQNTEDFRVQRELEVERTKAQNDRVATEVNTNVARNSADNDNRERRTAEATEQAIDDAVSNISEFVQAQRRNLDFSFNEDADRSVVKVTDTDTGELIRQIPSEEVLALSERIRGLQSDVGEAVGVLFSKEV